jgi:uncharacterized protein (DUF58 family)
LLTPRGWWFLVVVLLQVGLGTALSGMLGNGIAIIGLTLLAWFLWEWGQFAYRYYFVVPNLIVRRELVDERKAVPVLWAEGEFDVRVRVLLKGPGDLPYVALADWVPTDAKFREGNEEAIVAIRADRPATIEYRIGCPVPGELRFEGVRARIADRQGFFYHRTLIADGSTYPVLPRLTGAKGKRRGGKRHNIFPPPGVHRLKRTGGGSELLDLRDYIAGDPPKMIAWKASARKDKLITKEFESEVPVRCTLFVDASESTRLGTKRTKITRLVNLAAGVAEAAVADRDHAGLVVFDETDSQIMRPKRSRRHVIDMLHLLAKAASRPTPIGPFADANALARLAYPLANELYPDLMHRRSNTTPARMFWSPPSDYRRGWWIIPFWLPLIFLFFNYMSRQLFFHFEEPEWFYRSLMASYSLYQIFGEFTISLPIMGVLILKAWLWASGAALIGVIIWFAHGLSGFTEPWRSERLRRKQLGVLFATMDADAPGVECHYLHDDQVFARRAQRFLAEHHARYPVRLYDARGRYLFLGKPKIDVLVKALNYGVARGRDNELFVLMVDLIDLVDDMEHLVRAVRVAVARHHQVMVIVPWQEDIPDPPREPPTDERIPLRKAERFSHGGFRAIADELHRDFVSHYHRAYFRIRREFGRLGVVVIRADHDEPVQVILDRLDRLRGVGRRR